MTGFSFRIDMVFEWDGSVYRIDRLSAGGQVVLERQQDGEISLSSRSELLSAYGEGRISALKAASEHTTKELFVRPLKDLPPHVLEEVKRRGAYLHALMDRGDFAFTQECVGVLIHQIADQINDSKPPSIITLYRWYTRYRAHQDLRAVIPRFDQRGSSLLRQNDRILELSTEAIRDAFLASPAATGRNIYDRLLGKIRGENQRRLPSEQLLAPNIRTFYRMLQRMEAYDITVQRAGKAVADRRFRIAKAGPNVSHILERVEVDHTPLDLFLVDERTSLPLGRPILTMFIDWFSRFPLGYYLNFGGTSASAVMGALRHAILPKEPAAEVIPGLHVEHRWPCYGRMDALILDNGLEFHGMDLESVAFDLDIRLQFCPKHQPRFKGVVERYLKTVNYFFTHQMPGTSLAKLADRGDYDSQKHAVLTLGEFKHIFEKWLLDIYAETIHRGINTTPRARWEDGMKRRTPELPADIQQLKQRIGLVKERSLNRNGITLEGLRYVGDGLHPIIRTWGIGVKVRVVVDPEDLGSIQVWPPNQQEPITVLAIDQTYAAGLTLVQHDLIKRQVRDNGKSTEDTEALVEAKHQLAVALDNLIKSRKQRSRRRAASIHGITSNKPDSRLDIKAVTRLPQTKPPSVATPPNDHPPATLPTFRLHQGKGEA